MSYNEEKEDKMKVAILAVKSSQAGATLKEAWDGCKKFVTNKLSENGTEPPKLRVLTSSYAAFLTALADKALTDLESKGYITLNKDKDRADIVAQFAAQSFVVKATQFAVTELLDEAISCAPKKGGQNG